MSEENGTPPISGAVDLAVALHYDGTGAPRVTASGRDATAQRMIELAEAHDVPLYPDPDLAAVLARVPLGEAVPEALYRAVAEVIAFAYLVGGRHPSGEAAEGAVSAAGSGSETAGSAHAGDRRRRRAARSPR